MTGNNTLNLNAACITEAVQMWLDSKFKEGEGPTVMSVDKDTTGRYESAGMFVVTLSKEAKK